MNSSFLDGLALPGLVTCAGVHQIATFARAVGDARIKYKISPPDVDGPPEFCRVFRAQQNSLEFYPLSVVTLWLSSGFFHPVPSSLAYLGYLYSRNVYFSEYTKDSEKRKKPFILGIKFLQLLMLMSVVGIGHKALRYYGNIDAGQLLKDALPSLSN